MNFFNNLTIKIFSDGADKGEMLDMYSRPYIKGLTTNPTLMKKAGISDYSAFCKDILTHIKTKPLSFEVFSDDLAEMERQANEIASWGDNVYVKIPVTNTEGTSCAELIRRLNGADIKVNVTAIMTMEQVKQISEALRADVNNFVSIFAGRIADTGRDPIPIMKEALNLLKEKTCSELIWASPRELLNIFQANEIGCHIITVTNDILKKLPLVGYDLTSYSLDTVKMFYSDAMSAEFKL